MKIESNRNDEGLMVYPYGEFYKAIAALELAVKEKNFDVLLWCARRVLWFHDNSSETVQTNVLNTATAELWECAYRFTDDPPPALIADMVAPDKEDPPEVDAEEATAALDTLRQFLDGQNDMARKDYAAALESIEALRGKVSPAAGGAA
jgi:hypothetical protein